VKPVILLKDARWKKALHPYCKTIETIWDATKAKGELSIVLADDAFVRDLNKSYRGKDKPTNVLSFPNDEEPLGDVILAYETVAREAEEQKKSFKHHAAHLIVHGILHLQGHDHEEEEAAEKMERKEARILRGLGIADPYL